MTPIRWVHPDALLRDREPGMIPVVVVEPVEPMEYHAGARYEVAGEVVNEYGAGRSAIAVIEVRSEPGVEPR